MIDGAADGRDEAPDLAQLAQDWITIWQSELASLAADREAQETWQALLRFWAGAAGAMLTAARPVTPGRHDGAARHAGAADAARPPAAAAAPDARDAEIERLSRRIAELESRLADIERERR